MAKNIQVIPLENLLFDPENPRLPSGLKGVNDESKIIAYMLRDESLIELMKSIGESGYSDSEPLLVVPCVGDEEKYTVVEGNRRLAALKLLHDSSLAKIRPNAVREVCDEKRVTTTEIPAIVYDKRDEILDYLGYRHITGIKSWGALEKAKYLKQLYDRHLSNEGAEPTFKTLAKMIGSTAPYVGKLLASLNLYEYATENAYFDVDIDENKFEFSILSTAVGHENIYRHMGLHSSVDIDTTHIDKSNFEFVFKKLYNPKEKIADSRQISDLNSVIGSDLALNEYKKGANLSEALLYTSAPIEAFRQFLASAKKSLVNAKNSVERLPDDNAEIDILISNAEEVRKIAGTIIGALKEFLNDENEKN